MKAFDHRHYVPVLRWKRGEWNALRLIEDDDRDLITPLIELAPKDFRDWRSRGPGFVKEELEKRVGCVKEVWGERPVFFDGVLLDPDMRATGGLHPVELAAGVLASGGAGAVPVIGLGRDPAYEAAVGAAAKVLGHGVALRLRLPDLLRRTLDSDLARLLQNAPNVNEIDLIVDLGVIHAGVPTVRQILDRVGTPNRWRTFTVICGAFPKDLSDFRPGEHTLERSDWMWWRNQVLGTPRPPRLPAYGDYTTQHGSFSEPPPRPNFSASIRYTAEDHWVIMRGEGVFTDGGPGFAQWPANAMMLCEREEYCGEDFSAGDAYIQRMAIQTANTGNAETWLSASVNHHLVYSARQVASLAAS